MDEITVNIFVEVFYGQFLSVPKNNFKFIKEYG